MNILTLPLAALMPMVIHELGHFIVADASDFKGMI